MIVARVYRDSCIMFMGFGLAIKSLMVVKRSV